MRSLSFAALFLLLAACGRSGSTEGDGGSGGGAGGGAGGGGGLSCGGLSLEACRARTDCVADTCYACSCEPQFKGCRSPADPPFQCPALGCAQPQCCAAQGDCTAPATCAPPGTPYGCGACNPEAGACARRTCAADTDCRDGYCVNGECFAGQGECRLPVP